MKELTISLSPHVHSGRTLDRCMWNVVIALMAPFYYEAYAKGVNKGNALVKLCEILDLTADNVIAIGDEENDISMLKFAGTGVAMGNAVPAVKEVATHHTVDNDHDGVAQAIRELALKK